MSELRSGAPAHVHTLVDLVCERAARHGESLLYRFLDTGEIDGPRGELSFADLAQRACTIAAALQDRDLGGQRILLLYPPGLELIAAFFGCLCAGAVAVPAYPPDPGRLQQTLDRLQGIATDAQVGAVLTLSSIVPMRSGLAEHAAGLARLPWLATDSLDPALATGWRRPDLSPDALAMLQYTSGSTGTPRGALLSHANLLHNSLVIWRRFRSFEEGTTAIIWLPPYHDMGLIGGILHPLYYGGPATLMSPLHFLQAPLRWLTAISRERGTLSGGPNFAFELCLRKITAAERQALDLSSWKVAWVGAEPVRAQTIERFAETFAPHGFRKEAFYPCYGLAEGTLLVSGPRQPLSPLVVEPCALDALEERRVAPARAGAPSRALVSCGEIAEDFEARIVDPETGLPCAPDRVGEIWLAGPSVVSGYWNRPTETEQTFGAVLSGGDGTRFLRTGDLGFLREGRLFVTGRLKDVLILRGRNHHPEDIEQTVEASHPAIRPGCCAVFSVEANDEEQPVVVVEIGGGASGTDAEAVASAVRGAVAARHDLHAHAVVLAPARSIPKTLSGKVRRQACKTMLRSGALGAVRISPPTAAAELAPPSDPAPVPLPAPSIEEAPAGLRLQEKLTRLPEEARAPLLVQALLEQLARVLSIDVAELTPTTPFYSLGLDSLMMTELRYFIESQFTLTIPIEAFLKSEDPATLAAQIVALLKDDEGASRPPAAALATGTAEAGAWIPSSRQERLWHLDRAFPRRILDQITIVQRMRGKLDTSALRRAFHVVLERHDLLRTVYSAQDGQPRVAFAAEDIDLPVLDLRELPAAEWSEQVRRRADEMNGAPFDLATGPLVRALILAGRDDQCALLLTIHHIVCDMKSIEIFFRELVMSYGALAAGKAHAMLPPLRMRYADFAARQRRELESAEGLARLDWWRRRLADHPRMAAGTPVIAECHASVTGRSLPRRATQSLTALSQRNNASLFLTLMTAFASTLHRLSGEDDLLLHAHVLNRHSPEENALVGYFVNVLTVRADFSTPRSFAARLEETRRSWTEALQHELPISHLVRHLAGDRYAQRFMPATTAFNMVPFAVEDLCVGGLRFEAPMTRGRPTPFLFFERMLIVNPQPNGLRFNLLYNDLTLSPRDAENTADEFVEELDSLACSAD